MKQTPANAEGMPSLGGAPETHPSGVTAEERPVAAMIQMIHASRELGIGTPQSQEADRYYYSRDVLRERTRREFYTRRPVAKKLADALNQYVAKVAYAMSGKSFGHVQHGRYTADLLTSFVRSHFIAIDLIAGGELIEAATLVRKQMELLARLNELSRVTTLERLLRRTPNISALQGPLKKIYGLYSEIAHSSEAEWLRLLGTVEYRGKNTTPLFPHFSDDAYISLQHLALCVFEFFLWSHEFCERNFRDYDGEKALDWLTGTIEVFQLLIPESQGETATRRSQAPELKTE